MPDSTTPNHPISRAIHHATIMAFLLLPILNSTIVSSVKPKKREIKVPGIQYRISFVNDFGIITYFDLLACLLMRNFNQEACIAYLKQILVKDSYANTVTSVCRCHLGLGSATHGKETITIENSAARLQLLVSSQSETGGLCIEGVDDETIEKLREVGIKTNFQLAGMVYKIHWKLERWMELCKSLGIKRAAAEGTWEYVRATFKCDEVTQAAKDFEKESKTEEVVLDENDEKREEPKATTVRKQGKKSGKKSGKNAVARVTTATVVKGTAVDCRVPLKELHVPASLAKL